MPTKYTTIECANLCVHVSPQDASFIRKFNSSKTNAETWKIWPCHFALFDTRLQKCESFYSGHSENEWSFSKRFVLWTSQLRVRGIGLFIIITLVKKHNVPKVINTLLMERARWKRMKFNGSVSKGKITLLSKCGNVISGNYTRLVLGWKITWEKWVHSNVQCAMIS